jgi:MFS transporter, OPA family, solute carrier family 37 (glycerol-3-phosphate transporter), member 3
LFHAARKSFSNIKTTLSSQWRESCDHDVAKNKNYSCIPLEPDNIWNSHKLFENADDAEFFLGVLDASFLGAYSVV